MCEDTIQMKQLYGHTARVFALHCRGNYLATGEISVICFLLVRLDATCLKMLCDWLMHVSGLRGS